MTTTRDMLLDYMHSFAELSEEYLSMNECGECDQWLGDCINSDCGAEASFDPLDISWITRNDKSLLGVELKVALGGPNITMVVRYDSPVRVTGSWGFSDADLTTSHDAAQILEAYEEIHAIRQELN